MSLEYRTILRGVDGLPRPKQAFHQTIPGAEGWTKAVLEGLTAEQMKTAYVELFRTQETKIRELRLYVPPPAPEIK